MLASSATSCRFIAVAALLLGAHAAAVSANVAVAVADAAGKPLADGRQPRHRAP